MYTHIEIRNNRLCVTFPVKSLHKVLDSAGHLSGVLLTGDTPDRAHDGAGQPRGTWTGGQYRWCPVHRWLPGGLGGWAPEPARAELLRRWLHAYAPGTLADLRWWTGWTARDVSRTLVDIGAVEVALDSGPGYLLPDDLEASPEATSCIRVDHHVGVISSCVEVGLEPPRR